MARSLSTSGSPITDAARRSSFASSIANGRPIAPTARRSSVGFCASPTARRPLAKAPARSASAFENFNAFSVSTTSLRSCIGATNAASRRFGSTRSGVSRSSGLSPKIIVRMPVRAAISSPRLGSFPANSLRSSSETRSRETFASDGSAGSIAASVAGSSSNPSCEANRATRITRNPSSVNRATGSPTARNTRASRSFTPSNGSNIAFPATSYAIALTVRSRRNRSSCSGTPNTTESGRRASVYAPSPRYVVTSTCVSTPLPVTIVTVPCCSPVGIVRRNSFNTSSGCALVATSQSPGVRPSSTSRTAPPTVTA